MQKVIGINLNGNAYQLDEAGYEALRSYLARAGQALETNPDRAEIMADLEQAIADKCQGYLGPHKTVVSAGEVERIIAEMGPVESTAGENAGSAGGGTTTEEVRGAPPKRLYRVPAGAMIAGVCTGIAAYFKMDVAVVRIAFVLAALVTKGIAIVAYVVMMFVVPEASSPEEAAGGVPLNAKEVVDRAKQRSKEVGKRWRRHWRRHGPHAVTHDRVAPPFVAALGPVFGLAHIAIFLVAMSMLISLVNTGAVLGWPLPADIPVWAGALILLVVYQVAVSPFRIAQHWSWHPTAGPAAAPLAFWNAVAWLIGVAFAIWLASEHIPEIREFLRRLPDLFRDFAWAMRELITRER